MMKAASPVASAASGVKARPKPKPKAKAEAEAADADKQKAKRRSRPPQKKREADNAELDSRQPHKHQAQPHAVLDQPDLLESPERLLNAQTAYLDQMYLRAPRLLPEDVHGIKSLSASEVQSDLKRIQQSMAAFEARVASMVPGAAGAAKDGSAALLAAAADESEDDLAGMPYGNMLRDRRVHRNDGVVTPEEVVESVPVARRAVKITERELRALKRERDDLERDFMRLRTTYIWQMGEMKRMQKQQDRVMHVLSRDVIRKAKSLESSRRRTSALQDIMTELDARGSAIMRLTREKYQLQALLRKHNIELPEIEEVFIGDRVKCALFGFGQVADLNDDARIVVVDLDNGVRAYVQEEDVEVLSSEITYLEAEQQLKLKFFEKIGALVQPNGKFSMLGPRSSTRGRGRHNSDDDLDDDDSDEGSQSMDEDEDGSSDVGADDSAEKDGGKLDDRRTMAKDLLGQLRKKRKLIMNPSPANSSSKKKSKLQKVINFPATTLPVTPYEKGLLVSPLSTLPERVAAVGPNALQWLPSYLPSNMQEWEQERYQSLQMKGEIERLRFQLQKAEAEKLDAQQHASDQLESINQLVVQLEKLRESNGALMPLSTAHVGHTAESNEASGGEHVCPSCGGNAVSGGASRKNSTASNKSSKSTGGPRASNRKETAKRGRDNGGDGDSDSDAAMKSDSNDREEDAEVQEEAKSKSQDEDDGDGGDSSDAATSAARPTRSLRPRRKAAAATASQAK